MESIHPVLCQYQVIHSVQGQNEKISCRIQIENNQIFRLNEYLGDEIVEF